MANTSIRAAFERMWQYTLATISEKFNIYAQNDEPVDAPDGTLWVDMDDDGGYIEGSTGGSSGSSVSINLDTTLSKSGFAADAKAVGDALDGKLNESDLPEITEALTETLKSYIDDELIGGEW